MSAADAHLTLAASAKILAAQRRGTLSTRMYLRRLPTQIVLENASEDDLAWVRKHFPDGALEDHYGAVERRGRSGQRIEKHRYIARLRPEVEGASAWQRAPKIEVWGVEVPHVCHTFDGRVSGGKITWRCAAYRCNKVITKTKARELGLLL